MDVSEADRLARRTADHPVVEWGARAGYAVSGLLHLLIGWIALRVAWGRGGGSADQSGALATLAGNAGGQLLLWVAVVGFALLAVWQVAEAVRGGPGREATDRAKSAAKAVVYAVLAWTALGFARGGGSSSRSQTVDVTATVMGAPGGRLLVGAAGLAVVGVGAYHCWKGWTRGFLADLQEHPGAWAVHAGRFGYVAKGVALAVVGGLFVAAALHERPSEAAGLDGALKTLGGRPYGSVLLTVVALGLLAYGVYSFARARYARV
jgi:hypothetical protein